MCDDGDDPKRALDSSSRTDTDRTDIELMDLVNNGNRDAFAELVTRHIDALYRYAMRLCRDPVLADDLVQETWLSVWRKSSTFKPNKVRLTTWLHRIIHNQFIDWTRKHQRPSS